MSKKNKIQYLLISYLREFGSIELTLPDNVMLGIGVTQEDRHGNVIKSDNYCWVTAAKDDRTTLLDSYNSGISFEKGNKLIIEDFIEGEDGQTLHQLDIV